MSFDDCSKSVKRAGRQAAAPFGEGATSRVAGPGDLIDAKSRVLAMVSHELRTPLNGILGMTSLLAATTLTDEQRNYLDAVGQSGHALLALIEDLLDFSSMEAGRFHLRPEPGDVRDVVGSVVELSSARADEKGLDVAAYVSPDVPASIVADHARLRQVLFNLVGNALKFTERGGVLVTVVRTDAAVEFSVRDTGPGIAEADRTRIFEEFEQAGDGSRKSGAGLGLAISARLVAAMGGTISLASAPGEGSVFSFTVPCASHEPVQAPAPRDLATSRILLIAPPGPTQTALERFVRDRGGAVRSAADAAAIEAALAGLEGGAGALTDVIVDNRLAAEADRVLAALGGRAPMSLHRTMMVTPAERAALSEERARDYQAWLIRPLRPASLLKVLRRETGRTGNWLEERAPPQRLARQAALRPAKGPSRPLSFLLAEDNAVNALLVLAALERAGHRVTHVLDGRALVATCHAGDAGRPFDLVLSDLSMPGMDGIAAVKAIRAGEERKGLAAVPIVVLSADGGAEARAAALAVGADASLEKPVAPDQLVVFVESIGAARVDCAA
ncbi:MAG: ATP-binding protein, partial [Pararhizobium sp.]